MIIRLSFCSFRVMVHWCLCMSILGNLIGGTSTKLFVMLGNPLVMGTGQLVYDALHWLIFRGSGLLKQMKSHKYGWVFNPPVDVVKLGIPDYFQIIKHLMDLGTIKGKMSSCECSNPMNFAANVRLIFSNALTYDAAGY
ncbi:hypothetical protein Droror1_Dr00020126 [Drosera rotundifolia]